MNVHSLLPSSPPTHPVAGSDHLKQVTIWKQVQRTYFIFSFHGDNLTQATLPPLTLQQPAAACSDYSMLVTYVSLTSLLGGLIYFWSLDPVIYGEQSHVFHIISDTRNPAMSACAQTPRRPAAGA